MSDNQINSKRIAKNTIMLYVRMLLSIVVSLYTSRVVLQTLGVEDYGIYGVVGGVVSMFGFLNSAMSGATSRFLTYEMGQGDKGRLRDVFSSAMIIHIGIALVMFLLIETIGVWFLCNKLVIPEARMTAAHIVLQCSVFSMFFTVTQVPYNAAIISHEKMDVYAYVELLNVFLKLGIVYLLFVGDFDKLIFYAILQMAVSVFVAMVYRIYCLRNFEESRLHWVWNKDLLKPMITYSGWDLFGNFSVTVKQQGVNFLINMFFGVVFNAAASVAATIEGTLLSLSGNVITAFRPQIIKQYAAGHEELSVNYIYQAAKIATIMLVILAVPLIAEMDFIMQLWLGDPPEYASLFCRIMMIAGCVNLSTFAFNIGINATGRMKAMSFYTGVCYIGLIPLLYFCYKFDAPVQTAYYLSLLQIIITTSIRGYFLHDYIKSFSYKAFFLQVIVPVLTIAVVLSVLTFPLIRNMEDGFLRCTIVFAINVVAGFVLTLLIALNKNQRIKVHNYLKSKFIRH